MIELEEENLTEQTPMASASIKVLGIGGAGGNTINSMIDANSKGIDFIAANTDAQALELSKADCKIQFGFKSTKGLGTGADPELGRRAAEEDLDKIMETLADTDIVFLTAGMGGGTGSGALPVVSKALKDRGILSIAIVTKPFLFEGKKRTAIAEGAIDLIKDDVDTLIVIPNQKLLEVVDESVPMVEAFSMINEVLHQSVKGISDIIARPGHINVDFADVRAIMKGMGYAVMGTGRASGPGRAKEAALKSISSPLLENMSIAGAKGVLLNITGGPDLSLHEINQASNVIYEKVDEDANIILGSVIDESLTDEVYVTVIATGFTGVRKEHTVDTSLRLSDEKKVEEKTLEEGWPAVSDVTEINIDEPKAANEISFSADELEFLSEESEESEKLDEPEGEIRDPVVDVNDLDIPTFLRERSAEKEELDTE